MLSSILKFSAFTFLSKVTGLLRDIALAHVLGISAISDVFFIAFRLPNLFRAILADGAFNVVFTPMYTSKCDDDRLAAGFFLNNVFTILTVIVACFCIAGWLVMPLIVVLFAPGLDVDSMYFMKCVEASRIMFPYLLFASVCALFCGVLQSERRFGYAALNPVILNICMIIAAIFYIFNPLYAISVSVVVAGIIQIVFAWLCVWIQAGHKVRFIKPVVDDDARLLAARFAPAAVGACATRISIWIDTVIASIIPRAVSYMYYADRLYQIPRSLVGVAISYVILPELSRTIKKGDMQSALYMVNRALEIGYLLCIPAAVGLAVLADRFAAIFASGGVDSEDLVCISRILTVFAMAIPPVTSLNIVNTIFFANGDTRTSVKISFFCIAVNAVINLILINYVGYMSVPISTVAGSWLNFGILVRIACNRFGLRIDERLKSKMSMVCIASCVMAFVLYIGEIPFINMSGYLTQTLVSIILVIIGVIVYACFLKYTKVYSRSDVRDIFKLSN